MRKSITLVSLGALLSLSALTGCGGKVDKSDKYTKDGKLKISLRNLYFDNYRGGDSYLQELERQFQVKFSFNAYSWANWNTQVTGEVNGGNTPDVFHANVDNYNFKNYYLKWIDNKVVKALPSDLSRWENIAALFENTTNKEALKINGHYYGIPIAKNTTDYTTTYSPFTYMYRRDWAKQYNVYQPNDEYTWSQFENLLKTFANKFAGSGRYALGDDKWGYPSIVNFYKQVPHCFAYDETTHQYVNNYTTDEYIVGLQKSRDFMTKGYYYPNENTAKDGDITKLYYGNKIGVLFDNFSYANFYKAKAALIKSNESVSNFNVEDATAIMKIKGEDGKYALEGTDNWFSMTFFDYRISDNKMEKMLDILDWLLSEEGTRFAIYGIEDYDYEIVDGQIKLIDAYWPIDPKTGRYAEKNNGGKYIRYLASLGYDTLTYDPLSDKDVINYLNSWDQDMKTALENNELKVLKERAEVMWLVTDKKSSYCSIMRDDALKYVRQYIGGSISSIDSYKGKFGYPWPEVLEEINNYFANK